MAESQRIEDLRKRYHENPRRFFAPLANEYRKAGFLDRSLLLCEKHLREQPDNLNGLVVFGQTLFESGKHTEAREPFEAALALDQENLIALRHLGDIARLGGDTETAKRWYEKVLELDRRNDEVLDLLQQMGGGEAPDAAAAGTGSSPLITVGKGVSVSSGDDPAALGMVDLDPVPEKEPAAPPPPRPKSPASSGPGRTVVIDAAALAAADLKRAQSASAPTAEVNAMHAPIVESASAKAPIIEAPSAKARAAAPPPAHAPIVESPSAKAPRPSKRASLLDINFDFSDMPAEDAAPVAPSAPVMGAEAAEYGFAGEGVPDTAPTGAGEGTLIIDASPAGESLSASPAQGMAGLETSDLSAGADVSPMAGLESTEFTSGDVAPMAELEAQEMDTSTVVAPLAGLDRPDAVDAPEPVAEPASAAVAKPEEVHAAAAPTLEIAAVRPATPLEPIDLALNPPIDLDVPEDSSPLPLLEELPSARPKPRMTKADLSSLPLLADFGLEDDEPKTSPMEPAASAPAESAPIVEAPSASPDARKPQKTPAFVTETMAALYLQQGYKKEAMDVYRQLIAQDPSDAGMRDKLASLERGEDSGLEFEAPPADAVEPAPAPANAVLADMSFAGVGLTTPTPAAPTLDLPTAAGPSARDFFSGFARRGAQTTNGAASAAAPAAAEAPAPEPAAQPVADAVPAASASVSTSGWPLDTLFGAANDVADLHAAEVLAGIATFAGPSGGTGLDELFSAGASPARPVVARASQTLKFDQFFAGGAAPAAAPDAPAESASPAAAGDDDLDKFQGWLKGLKPPQ
jgi:hypothetical protein